MHVSWNNGVNYKIEQSSPHSELLSAFAPKSSSSESKEESREINQENILNRTSALQPELDISRLNIYQTLADH